MRRVNGTQVLLGAALLALPSAAAAAGGRIPIHMQTMITEPGSYEVTRSFSVAGGPAISIMTPGVEIDLGGHTIEQLDQGSDAIEIVLPAALTAYPMIRIHHGQIDGGRNGISLLSPTGCIFGLTVDLSHLAIQQQQEMGVNVQNGCTPAAPTFVVSLMDSQIGWVFTGLNLQGVSQIRTERVNVTGVWGPAVVVQNSSEWIGENIIIGYPWSDGIRLQQVQSATIRWVVVSRPAGNGVVMEGVGGVTMSYFTAYQPTLSGIKVMDSADITVTNSWISSAGMHGIEAINSRNLRFVDGVIGASQDAGLSMDQVDTLHVMTLSIQGSGGPGIRLMETRSATLCENNVAGNRIGIEISGGSEAIAVNDNNVSRNTGDGILVDSMSYGAVGDNLASRNGGAGIRFGPLTFENVYSDNRTRGNSLGGIIAPPGGGNIDGGGNI